MKKYTYVQLVSAEHGTWKNHTSTKELSSMLVQRPDLEIVFNLHMNPIGKCTQL
jgi:hypothetical protein